MKALEALKRGLALLIGRAVIAKVDDGGLVQELQLRRLADETGDGLERFQHGLYTQPKPGAEAVVVSAGGVRSHGLVIAVCDRRFRLMGMAEGEVAIADDLGQVVWLKRDGIAIDSATKVTVTSPAIKLDGDVEITGDLVSRGECDLGGTGGVTVKRSDNTPATKVRAV